MTIQDVLVLGTAALAAAWLVKTLVLPATAKRNAIDVPVKNLTRRRRQLPPHAVRGVGGEK